MALLWQHSQAKIYICCPACGNQRTSELSLYFSFIQQCCVSRITVSQGHSSSKANNICQYQRIEIESIEMQRLVKRKK